MLLSKPMEVMYMKSHRTDRAGEVLLRDISEQIQSPRGPVTLTASYVRIKKKDRVRCQRSNLERGTGHG